MESEYIRLIQKQRGYYAEEKSPAGKHMVANNRGHWGDPITYYQDKIAEEVAAKTSIHSNQKKVPDSKSEANLGPIVSGSDRIFEIIHICISNP
jgi:hypothetical protein